MEPFIGRVPRLGKVLLWALGVLSAIAFGGLAASGGAGPSALEGGLAVFSGLLVAGFTFSASRMFVIADDRGIRGRNLLTGFDVPWSSVNQIRPGPQGLEIIADGHTTLVRAISTSRLAVARHRGSAADVAAERLAAMAGQVTGKSATEFLPTEDERVQAAFESRKILLAMLTAVVLLVLLRLVVLRS